MMTVHTARQINLTEIVGGAHCVSSSDGSLVHDLLAEHLTRDEDVVLSFVGVEDVTSAFLNSAVGQLYGDFTESQIRSHLQVVGGSADQLAFLERVVDRAKEFFKDPEAINAAVSGVLGE